MSDIILVKKEHDKINEKIKSSSKRRKGEGGKSEILGFEWHLGEGLSVRNRTGYYHGLFKSWWDYFGLSGSGLLIGEDGKFGENAKEVLLEYYPNIEEIFTVSLGDQGYSDIICDIQVNLPVPRKMDWIVCQAVLEHLGDPFGAVCNMFDALVVGGRCYFHTVGPPYRYHRHPIDCLRFFRDAFIEWNRLAGNVCIDDILCTKEHRFVVYRKTTENEEEEEKMAKGVYANSGLCLTCRRYSPKSLSNCKIVQDALEKCSFYLEREDIPKNYRKKKKRETKKQEAEYITDERTTINALLQKEKP